MSHTFKPMCRTRKCFHAMPITLPKALDTALFYLLYERINQPSSGFFRGNFLRNCERHQANRKLSKAFERYFAQTVLCFHEHIDIHVFATSFLFPIKLEVWCHHYDVF